MSIRIFSAAINGIDAQLIEVEVDSNPGLHSFNIVGLPDKAVQESKDRIASAIKNAGFTSPKSKNRKIVINLAPADIKKEGPSYDLPIAIGYLLETDQIKFDSGKTLFIGELSLDGSLKHTSGVLASAILAKNQGFKEIIIPSSNTSEASIIDRINTIGANNLKEVIGHLNRTSVIDKSKKPEPDGNNSFRSDSFISIVGQEYAKRAAIISAAGFHNMLMTGPPGSGKTILAKAIVDILPQMSFDEAMEVAKIYSSVGLIKGSPLNFRRPFRNPHHTTSAVAIVGGGTWPKPGEISLAHRGVLFLDELPEFNRNVIESLRQPLEDGHITISRASGSVSIPAKFMLIAAMNMCPCGNFGTNNNECICQPHNILKYRKRVSGPLMDRMDIQVDVPREIVGDDEIDTSSTNNNLDSTIIKINFARKVQLERFKNMGIFSNAEMDFKSVEKMSQCERKATLLLKKALRANNMSMRGYHKTIKVSRTIADLDSSETVKDDHVAEALNLRINDKLFSNLV